MKKSLVVILLAVLAISVLSISVFPSQASAATDPTNVIVYVGQLGASTYQQSLNGVLYTEQQILWTQGQIGDMANRIVYVTEISQNNTVKVIYMVTSLWPMGQSNGGYQYQVALIPITALPAGW